VAPAAGSPSKKHMKTKSEVAVEKFFSGYNCAQSVWLAFCGDLDLDKDMALRMASGFGGGMGGRQEVCGAVSRGVIAIGLNHGRGEGQDKQKADGAYGKVRKLMSQFESKHGSCICEIRCVAIGRQNVKACPVAE